MNPIKVYNHPVENIWISFFNSYFHILMILASRMRSYRKVYQNFIFNFEDIWKKKVFMTDLICYLSQTL